MVWLYIILIFIALLSFRFPQKEIVEGFSGKHTANIVKGIFIWMVFISHIAQYVAPAYPNALDSAYILFNSFWGQMIVVAFLFYSGYGVLTNIKRKGCEYTESIPTRRVPGVLLNFDVAVLLFILIDILIGIDVPLCQALLTFTAWDSVGNSNWYIFAIMILYLFSYASSKYFGYSIKGIICLCVLVLCYILVMGLLKPSWWYDTVFAYVFGSIYCRYQSKIDRFLSQYYLISLIAAIVGFTILFFVREPFGLATNLRAVVMCVLIILFTMRIPLRNSFLAWSGKNLFPIYIYQRMPMLILSEVAIGGITLLEYSLTLYIIFCCISTLLIAYFHKYIRVNIDKMCNKSQM